VNGSMDEEYYTSLSTGAGLADHVMVHCTVIRPVQPLGNLPNPRAHPTSLTLGSVMP
jgi:hypothetical protein